MRVTLPSPVLPCPCLSTLRLEAATSVDVLLFPSQKPRRLGRRVQQIRLSLTQVCSPSIRATAFEGLLVRWWMVYVCTHREGGPQCPHRTFVQRGLGRSATSPPAHNKHIIQCHLPLPAPTVSPPSSPSIITLLTPREQPLHLVRLTRSACYSSKAHPYYHDVPRQPIHFPYSPRPLEHPLIGDISALPYWQRSSTLVDRSHL
ncbi:hypothetical protein IE81DRAFT_88063 [Ceraceosorus guamensis]|uniref:Uncharacterized protein n=1 Tax=Ceraceosorus guamensis TaxID=1522189 RepID=A0A316W4Q2_9BASI|nr:hypothetical protein IE81DRAFT_88063 [Ceraceosorus guamensis]PWN43363.1 hypothetical protein IE81DRAFT_88063 [Ceraceosorus guamensis]